MGYESLSWQINRYEISQHTKQEIIIIIIIIIIITTTTTTTIIYIFFSNLYLNLEPSLMNPTSLGGRSACESLKNEWCSTPTFQSLFVALKLASLKLSTVPP